jgi:hypothetical protein
VDVDLTLFLAPDKPAECVAVLQGIGCEFSAVDIARSLADHGFCRVALRGVRVDGFLPIVSFYEDAKRRRRRVHLEDQSIFIWDAETLCVFKMMFFRHKDFVDVEQILRTHGASLDRAWIRSQLLDLYGARDPRLSQWDDLARGIPAA